MKKFPPKFIGAVLSMFNVAGKTFKPVKQASLWISLIEQSLDEELLPVLEALGMNRSSARTSVLAQVPSFLQLTQLSHSAYVPVFAVRGDMRAMDGEGDLVPVPEVERERHLAKAKWFKEVFCRFALEFLRVWEAGCVNKQ